MITPCTPDDNHLLAALAGGDLDRLQPYFDAVALDVGESIYEPGSELPYLYFPTTAIISILHLTQEGESVETAVVGCEGAVSIATYLGGGTTVGRAVVLVPGMGIRVPAQVIRQDFERGHDVRRVLLRYAQALLTQMAQTAVCNRHHEVAQQLCRWILSMLDRVGPREIPMTHQQIADMLGVRREGVTEAARKLKEAGVIGYSRGSVRVLDRPALEDCACACYDLVREEYNRLLR